MWASGDRETRLRAGTQPAWRSRLPAEPKPDLDQLAPQDLSLLESGGRVLLGFASAVRNIGDAPMELVASRPTTTVPVMTAAQRLARRLIPNVGLLRYRHADNHLHWHYLAFERYELRTLDGRFLVRDREERLSAWSTATPAPAAARSSSTTAGNTGRTRCESARASHPARPTSTPPTTTGRTSTSPAWRRVPTSSSTASTRSSTSRRPTTRTTRPRS